MTHIMMDLETFGTAPGCAIRSIGAVVFDRTVVGAEFYANIDPQSCRGVGLLIDPATIDWWKKQPEAVREIFDDNPRPIMEVINDFHSWFLMQKGMFLWAHGTVFDVGIWEEACRRSNMRWPWNFHNIRDTRTLFHVARYHPRKSDNLIPHFALEDAKHQARCVQEARDRIDPPNYVNEVC